MAKAITQADIKRINIEYLNCHTYAETARRTGFSPTTVKRYIIPGFTVVDASALRKFDLKRDMPQDEKWLEIFRNTEDWGSLCEYQTDEEFAHVTDIWNELEI